MNLTEDEIHIVSLLRQLPEDKVKMFRNDLSMVLSPRVEKPTDSDFSFVVEAKDKKPKKRALEDIGRQKKGLLDWIGDLFTDEKQKLEKKKLQDYLVRNFDKYKGAQKVLKENRDLAEYLSGALDSGDLTPASLTVFMELAARDPSWASKLELDYDPSKVKLKAYLPAFEEYIKKVDWDLTPKMLKSTINRLVDTHIKPAGELRVEVSDSSDPAKKEVVVHGPLDDLLKIMKEFKIKPDDLIEPLF